MLNEYQRCHTTITTVCDIDVIMTISGVRLPASSRTIYSYFVDMDSGNFVAWDALVPTTQSLIERGAVITIGKYGKKWKPWQKAYSQQIPCPMEIPTDLPLCDVACVFHMHDFCHRSSSSWPLENTYCIHSFTRACPNSRAPFFLNRMKALMTWSIPCYFCILWHASSAKCGTTQIIPSWTKVTCLYCNDG